MTTIGDLRHVMVGTISPPSAQLGGLQLPLAHAQVAHANHAHTHVQTSYTHAHVHSADLPRINPTLPVNDSTLFAVYCFIKNFIGTSTANTVAIDNKIEQAMDLVKSHLMFAVREEVEVLKEKIAELMDRINQLEYENGLLKTHATPETLAQVSALQAVMSGTPPIQHRPIAQTGGGGSQQ